MVKLNELKYGQNVTTPAGAGQFVGVIHRGDLSQALILTLAIDPLTEQRQVLAVPVEQLQVMTLESVEA